MGPCPGLRLAPRVSFRSANLTASPPAGRPETPVAPSLASSPSSSAWQPGSALETPAFSLAWPLSPHCSPSEAKLKFPETAMCFPASGSLHLLFPPPGRPTVSTS